MLYWTKRGVASCPKKARLVHVCYRGSQYDVRPLFGRSCQHGNCYISFQVLGKKVNGPQKVYKKLGKFLPKIIKNLENNIFGWKESQLR